MKRREFFKNGFIVISILAVSSKMKILDAAEYASNLAKDYKTKIVGIIKSLKEKAQISFQK
ncbi:MAG: hypothetical protein J5I57_09005 [Melioribacteraceae bacterium]|nr:hypothetical protein [Melioribacteraceae bacterium]